VGTKIRIGLTQRKIKACFLRILLRGNDCTEVKRRNTVARFDAFMGSLGMKFEEIVSVFLAAIHA
jgi:hypothetical protein